MFLLPHLTLLLNNERKDHQLGSYYKTYACIHKCKNYDSTNWNKIWLISSVTIHQKNACEYTYGHCAYQ